MEQKYDDQTIETDGVELMNFTKGMLEKFRVITDAPDMFILASAYHLLSYLPGRFCSSTYGKKLKPNVYIILSCVPGRGRRSTIAGWDSKITNNVLQKYYGEHGEYEEDHPKSLKAQIQMEHEIIEDGTPEGISDHIGETKTKILDIRSTEFGSVFEKMKEGGYAYGLSSFYSRLYYGESYSQKLSTRREQKSRKVPEGMYTTMFCGMQEPYLYIKPAMIREGLIRRLILCYVPVEKLALWKPPLDVDTYTKTEDAFDWVTTHLLEIYKYFEETKEARNIIFEEEAVSLINSISKNYEAKVTTVPGDLTIYLQSTWENVAKLSMLETIGRKASLVTKEDVSKALEFYKPIIDQSEEVINSLSEEKPIVTVRRATERVYAAIASEGTIDRQTLYRKMGLSKTDLDEYIETLVEQKKIQKISGKPLKYTTTK
jgi:hypothetical protein